MVAALVGPAVRISVERMFEVDLGAEAAHAAEEEAAAAAAKVEDLQAEQAALRAKMVELGLSEAERPGGSAAPARGVGLFRAAATAIAAAQAMAAPTRLVPLPKQSIDPGTKMTVTVAVPRTAPGVPLGLKIASPAAGANKTTGPVVSGTIPGSAADLCKGFRVGDMLVSIDGQKLSGISHEEAVQLIAASNSTEATFTVLRAASLPRPSLHDIAPIRGTQVWGITHPPPALEHIRLVAVTHI